MDVQVARVPAGLLALRLGAVARLLVRLGRRTRGRWSTPPPPARRRGRRRRPSARPAIAARPSSAYQRPGRIGPGRNPRVVLPGTWPFGLARYSASVEKPSRRDRHVGMARAAPAAELGPARSVSPACTRLVDPQVERVADVGRRRLGLVEAVLHAHRRRAGRDVEGHEHVAALEARLEAAGGELVEPDRVTGARLGDGGGDRVGAVASVCACAVPASARIRARVEQGTAHGEGRVYAEWRPLGSRKSGDDHGSPRRQGGDRHRLGPRHRARDGRAALRARREGAHQRPRRRRRRADGVARSRARPRSTPATSPRRARADELVADRDRRLGQASTSSSTTPATRSTRRSTR